MCNIVRGINKSLSYAVLIAKDAISVPCLAHYSLAISFDVDTTQARLPQGTKIFAEIDSTKHKLNCNLLSNKATIIDDVKSRLFSKYSECCEESEFVVDAIKLQIDKSMLELFDKRDATESDMLDIWCK